MSTTTMSAREDAKACADDLVLSNMKLVHYLVRYKLHVPKHLYEDCVQAGMLGLCKAAKHFDPSKGYAFATFASKCIVNEVYMSLRTHLKYESKTIRESEFVLGDDDSLTIFDVIPDPEIIEDICARNDLQRRAVAAVHRLDGHAQRALVLYFGLDGHARHTQLEASQQIGISQSYISRILRQQCNILQKTLQKIN